MHMRAFVYEYAHMEAVMKGRAHVFLWRHMNLWDHKSVESEIVGKVGLCCREECTGMDCSSSDSGSRLHPDIGKVCHCKTTGPWT